MMKRLLALPVRVGVVVTALVLAAAGCAEDASGGAGNKTVTMGVVPGWSGNVAVVNLYRAILEDNGYTVDVKEFSEIVPIYAGVAQGDIDVMPAWPERTQKDYWDKYKDKVEDFGSLYDNASLYLAVPDYVDDVKSISDLRSRASQFDGKIIGIERGAGITKVTQDKVFPAYELDDSFDLVLSSTPAMLTELKKATDAREPIVVTLWAPYWANQTFPVRPLEDPKGAYGEPEGVHTLARKGFSEGLPEVAEMMKNFKLTDEQYGSVLDTMANKYGEGQEQKAAKAWLDENPDFASALEKYLKS